jgi:hypothetical protein
VQQGKSSVTPDVLTGLLLGISNTVKTNVLLLMRMVALCADAEDERFLVKTMRKSEMSVLLGMLEQYSQHMEAYPNSLITRFFGLHKVTPAHGRSVSCCWRLGGAMLCS